MGLSSRPSPLRSAVLHEPRAETLNCLTLALPVSHPPCLALCRALCVCVSLRDLAVSWSSGKCDWGEGNGAAGGRASGTMSEYAVCASSFSRHFEPFSRCVTAARLDIWKGVCYLSFGVRRCPSVLLSVTRLFARQTWRIRQLQTVYK